MPNIQQDFSLLESQAQIAKIRSLDAPSQNTKQIHITRVADLHVNPANAPHEHLRHLLEEHLRS